MNVWSILPSIQFICIPSQPLTTTTDSSTARRRLTHIRLRPRLPHSSLSFLVVSSPSRPFTLLPSNRRLTATGISGISLPSVPKQQPHRRGEISSRQLLRRPHRLLHRAPSLLLPSFPKERVVCVVCVSGVESSGDANALFSKLPDRWLKLGRRSPGPAGPFFPPFQLFAFFKIMKQFRGRVVVVLLCLGFRCALPQYLCSRRTCVVPAVHTYHKYRTYDMIVHHPVQPVMHCTALHCTIHTFFSLYTSGQVHSITLSTQHHPWAPYETTRHKPPDLFRSQPEPLISPNA